MVQCGETGSSTSPSIYQQNYINLYLRKLQEPIRVSSFGVLFSIFLLIHLLLPPAYFTSFPCHLLSLSLPLLSSFTSSSYTLFCKLSFPPLGIRMIRKLPLSLSIAFFSLIINRSSFDSSLVPPLSAAISFLINQVYTQRKTWMKKWMKVYAGLDVQIMRVLIEPYRGALGTKQESEIVHNGEIFLSCLPSH